ncbi:Acetylcholine Receptor Subunit Epsilon [Manis pentadactyla]|nr:Acetylcholine Receptor Subunit Epsilon [Manis pentadactyla]
MSIDHLGFQRSLLRCNHPRKERRGKTFGLQPKQTPGSRSDLHCSDIMNMAENTGTPTVVVGVVLEAMLALDLSEDTMTSPLWFAVTQVL